MGNALAGKVAVITGGASGIGRQCALRFLNEGARVIIGDIQEDRGEETIEAARAQGTPDIEFIRTDVSEEKDVEAMIGLAVSTYGRLDCVYCNAGWLGTRGSLLDVTMSEYERVVAVNLGSVFLGFKHGGRVLKQQGQGGTLIATSSSAALVKQSLSIYATAKYGVAHLARQFACELGPYGIRVNTIVPGAIVTPMWPDQAAAREKLKNAQPLPWNGEPSDIANMALFLASDESRFVSGSTMLVDGGLIADGAGRFNRLMS